MPAEIHGAIAGSGMSDAKIRYVDQAAVDVECADAARKPADRGEGAAGDRARAADVHRLNTEPTDLQVARETERAAADVDRAFRANAGVAVVAPDAAIAGGPNSDAAAGNAENADGRTVEDRAVAHGVVRRFRPHGQAPCGVALPPLTLGVLAPLIVPSFTNEPPVTLIAPVCVAEVGKLGD